MSGGAASRDQILLSGASTPVTPCLTVVRLLPAPPDWTLPGPRHHDKARAARLGEPLLELGIDRAGVAPGYRLACHRHRTRWLWRCPGRQCQKSCGMTLVARRCHYAIHVRKIGRAHV